MAVDKAILVKLLEADIDGSIAEGLEQVGESFAGSRKLIGVAARNALKDAEAADPGAAADISELRAFLNGAYPALAKSQGGRPAVEDDLVDGVPTTRRAAARSGLPSRAEAIDAVFGDTLVTGEARDACERFVAAEKGFDALGDAVNSAAELRRTLAEVKRLCAADTPGALLERKLEELGRRVDEFDELVTVRLEQAGFKGDAATPDRSSFKARSMEAVQEGYELAGGLVVNLRKIAATASSERERGR